AATCAEPCTNLFERLASAELHMRRLKAVEEGTAHHARTAKLHESSVIAIGKFRHQSREVIADVAVDLHPHGGRRLSAERRPKNEHDDAEKKKSLHETFHQSLRPKTPAWARWWEGEAIPHGSFHHPSSG